MGLGTENFRSNKIKVVNQFIDGMKVTMVPNKLRLNPLCESGGREIVYVVKEGSKKVLGYRVVNFSNFFNAIKKSGFVDKKGKKIVKVLDQDLKVHYEI